MSLFERWFGRSSGAATPSGPPERVAEVTGVLEDLAPALAADGGAVELIDVDEGTVRLRFRGSCSGCFSRADTLRGLIEPRLRERCPWIVSIDAA